MYLGIMEHHSHFKYGEEATWVASHCQDSASGLQSCHLCPATKFKPATAAKLRKHLELSHVKQAVTVEGG